MCCYIGNGDGDGGSGGGRSITAATPFVLFIPEISSITYIIYVIISGTVLVGLLYLILVSDTSTKEYLLG